MAYDDEVLLTGRAPYSQEAEQAVLGAMLVDARCVPEVMERVDAEDFHVKVNRQIFDAIYNMFVFSQAIDPVTVLDMMKHNGTYSEDSRAYAIQLMESTPTAANVSEYIAILKDKSLLRQLARLASDLSSQIEEDTEKGQVLLEGLEEQITGIRQKRSRSGLSPLSDVLFKVYNRLNELATSNRDIPGISTGLKDLDRAISGLNKSDLILLAARPGMGKTSMALNILLEAGKRAGKQVAFFSLEMSEEQLGMRLLASQSLVDNKKLVTGRMTEEEWAKLSDATATLQTLPVYIDDDSSVTVADVTAKCRRLENLGLVIIDYLQLMQSAGGKARSGDSRQQQISDITRALKLMAKDLNVPVVCLSQLSRATENRTDKRPLLSDLRDSGAIEQDADIVLFLYRDGYYNSESPTPNVAECIVAKNRHGETGTIELQWSPEYTTFTNLSWQEGE